MIFYIPTVMWLISCDSAMLQQRLSSMTLDQWKDSMSVRSCYVQAPHTTYRSSFHHKGEICVENKTDEVGYWSILPYPDREIVEEGLNITDCTGEPVS